MLLKLIFPVIVVWSLVAVILHCSGVGMFAEWPVTDWPWHWSCLCIFWWDMVVPLACVVILFVFKRIIWLLDD